ncbi:MAG TPA: rhombosortase [Gammaproteobacteria bacterium]|nr:rhombosortase [Gammaproteobacteria bacterium]
MLTIFVVCLALAAGGDALREVGRYQRDAIEGGQYWRLVSGHLVHLGLGHLWPNLAALLVIGALFDDVFRSVDWLRASLASAAAIDVGLYVLDPDVIWYVGLSGVLHGLVAAGAFALLLRRQKIGAVLAAGLGAKLAFEQLAGPLPFTAESVGGPVVVAAHLYGAAGGLLAEAVAHVVRRRRSQV